MVDEAIHVYYDIAQKCFFSCHATCVLHSYSYLMQEYKFKFNQAVSLLLAHFI